MQQRKQETEMKQGTIKKSHTLWKTAAETAMRQKPHATIGHQGFQSRWTKTQEKHTEVWYYGSNGGSDVRFMYGRACCK